MNEKFKKLAEKLNADQQLAENLLNQETAEGAQAVLNGAGFEFSIAEIMELLNEFTKEQLSDEELEGVAGGFFIWGRPGSQNWGINPGPGGGPIIGPGIGGPGGRPFRPTW